MRGLRKGFPFFACLLAVLLAAGWGYSTEKSRFEIPAFEKMLQGTNTLSALNLEWDSDAQRRRGPYRDMGPSPGPRFAIKLVGGLDYLLLGDLNNSFDGYNKGFNADADPGSLTGKYNNLNWAYDGYGEFIFYASPNFGIGLGAGYLQAKTKNDTVTFTYAGGIPATFDEDWTISAIPLRADVYFTVPMGPSAALHFNLGGDYYFGSLEMKGEWNVILAGIEESAKGKTVNTIGGHGGLGFELKMSPNVSFILEVQGRLATFKSIEADYKGEGWVLFWPVSYDETRKLYYYDYQSGGDSYPRVGWWDTAPSGSSYKNVREGNIDLSGLFFGGGLKINF